MKHCMLDLETFGTEPGCVILSIGAVVFDIENGVTERFYSVVDLQSCLDVGLKIDARTLGWWLQQSEEARAIFKADYSDSLHSAIKKFQNFYRLHNCERVWGHGSLFDIAVFEAAMRALTYTTFPWGFRDVRDTRTLYEIADVKPKPKPHGTLHNALDDAESQALAVIEAYQKIVVL